MRLRTISADWIIVKILRSINEAYSSRQFSINYLTQVKIFQIYVQDYCTVGVVPNQQQGTRNLHLTSLGYWRLIMEDKMVARNIAVTVGVIMLVALGLVTLSTIIGNSF